MKLLFSAHATIPGNVAIILGILVVVAVVVAVVGYIVWSARQDFHDDHH